MVVCECAHVCEPRHRQQSTQAARLEMTLKRSTDSAWLFITSIFAHQRLCVPDAFDLLIKKVNPTLFSSQSSFLLNQLSLAPSLPLRTK